VHLSYARLVSSSEFGEMRSLTTLLADDLSRLSTELLSRDEKSCNDQQIFILSISTAFVLEPRPSTASSSSEVLQRIYMTDLTYKLPSLTKPALIVTAEHVATELHAFYSSSVTTFGCLQQLRMRMDLSTPTGLGCSSTTATDRHSPATRTAL